MRVGQNPQKSTLLQKETYLHKVVIPVFIPDNNDAYHQHSFEVLQLCMDSLLTTIHDKTCVVVIDNASKPVVASYLDGLLAQHRIHQLIRYASNDGKVDPVVSVMKGALEPLITVTDADVLFKKGWQQAVEKIFVQLPNVGMVSPVPQPANHRYFNAWSWFFGMQKKCFIQEPNADLDALHKFKESTVGTAYTLSDIEKEPLGIAYNGVKAILGAGHFCATYHRAVLPFIPNRTSGLVFNEAEKMFLDKPVEDAHLMRLATFEGWAYHMGNVPEAWMYAVQANNLKDETPMLVNAAVDSLLQNGFLKKHPLVLKWIKKVTHTTRYKLKAFSIAAKNQKK